jgi:hypothetical protein
MIAAAKRTGVEATTALNIRRIVRPLSSVAANAKTTI